MAYYDLLPKEELYDSLAEEATELAHACLKISRKLRGINPTPLSEDEIRKMITEEFTDVINVASVLHLESDLEISRNKLSRWDERLKNIPFDAKPWPNHPLCSSQRPLRGGHS